MNDSCLFCRIVAGETDDEIILQTDTHTAFLDAFPNTVGFTVAVPNDHHSSNISRVPRGVVESLVGFCIVVNDLLVTTYPDVDRCGIGFEGYGVNHFHAKLQPLHGTLDDGGQVVKVRSTNKTFYPTYPGYMAFHTSERANTGELARVAANIRLFT